MSSLADMLRDQSRVALEDQKISAAGSRAEVL